MLVAVRVFLILALMACVGFAGWSAPVMVGTPFEENAYGPSVAIDSSDVIHLLYNSDASELLYINSSDSGLTWSSSPFALTAGIEDFYNIVFDSSDNLYAFFIYSEGLYLRKSTDRGSTWGSNVNISNKSSEGISYYGVDIDSNNVIHVAVRLYNSSLAEDLYKVHYTNSSNGGASFNAPVLIGSISTLVDYGVELCLNGSDVYVAFESYTPVGGEPDPETYSVYLVKSDDSGETWPGASNIWVSYETNSDISLKCDSRGYLHLLITGSDSGTHFSNYSYSADKGSSWGSNVSLETSSENIYIYRGKLFLDSSDYLYASLNIFHEAVESNFSVFNSSDGVSWSKSLISHPEGRSNNAPYFYTIAFNSSEVPFAFFESCDAEWNCLLFFSVLEDDETEDSGGYARIIAASGFDFFLCVSLFAISIVFSLAIMKKRG